MEGFNHVDPGGPPLVVPLSGSITMIKVSVGPVDNNAYLLQSRNNGSLLLDAANDDDGLLKIISDQSLDTIVTTHRHADHWQALPSVAAATGAGLICGQPDLQAISIGAGVEGLVGSGTVIRSNWAQSASRSLGWLGIRQVRSRSRTRAPA